MKKENRAKLTFHHGTRKIYILGHTNAVMIAADVLTAHFGILRRCAATASELRHYKRISPTL
jgi:hypothetical protein